MIVETAHAKVNLCLHVTGRRTDGYHLLNSLVAFTDLGDRLTLSPAPALSLRVSGPFAEGVPTGADNLVLRAAGLFTPTPAAAIALEKHLPHAAGIGGGSADAAAALRGLARLEGLALPAPGAVLSLGADLPVCLSPAPRIMRGIGEDLHPAPPLPPLHAVLVNPGAAVPTGPVFAGLATRDNPEMTRPEWSDFASLIAWLARQRNDLEPVARQLAPEISETLAALNGEDVALARMSGSGATCFGLVETRDQADAIEARLTARRPDWWVRAVSFLS